MNTTNKPLRIALIGAGEWAREYHLPSLAVLAKETAIEIAGIWNRTRETAEQVARQFSIGRVYDDLADALNDEHLDCFVVLVNSNVLLEIVSKLMVRGVPIFTEKPPGKTYLDALLLAQRIKVPNVVAFNRRYMPINRRFKQIADGIDRPYFAECHFYRNERNYDHFVRETGVHGINYMEYLCGPIIAVRTETGTISKNGSDFWISSVVFESGICGLFKFFPCCGSSIERYELHGRNTSIYLHCPQSYTSDHPGKIEVHEHGRVISTLDDDDGDGLLTMGIIDEYRDFFRAITERSNTASNFGNAANTMKVAEAIESGTVMGASHFACAQVGAH
ncbi:MAG: Gfo/Idh/MocA family oxidoreductase [Polaromonas sp.]|nr:Gfo/Idh/MocA family oxidoreductase [Polaromonas sp.]